MSLVVQIPTFDIGWHLRTFNGVTFVMNTPSCWTSFLRTCAVLFILIFDENIQQQKDGGVTSIVFLDIDYSVQVRDHSFMRRIGGCHNREHTHSHEGTHLYVHACTAICAYGVGEYGLIHTCICNFSYLFCFLFRVAKDAKDGQCLLCCSVCLCP